MSQARHWGLRELASEIEERFLQFVTQYSVTILRYSLVVVFVWFGLLTAAGMSETAEVVAALFGVIPTDLFLLVFGGWEIAIGVALLSRRTVLLAVGLMVVHLTVMMAALVLFPSVTFAYVPYGPSFEGVYILKDLVLLGGVMTVAGHLTRPDE